MKKLLILSAIILLPSPPVYASGLSGTPCTVQQLNQTQQSGNHTYKCLLLNNKFIWGNGTPVPGSNPKIPGTRIAPKTNTSPQITQIPNNPPSNLYPDIIQVTNMRIWGTTSPGELLTVEGGEWESPTPLKISYEWQFCIGDSSDYHAGGPSYFKSENDIDLKSKKICKKVKNKSTGKTFLIPEKTTNGIYITVRQYVKLSTWNNGRGFYTYAPSVQTDN